MFALSLFKSKAYRGGVMHAITRYIFGQLVTATVAITLGLAFAIWLAQSLRQIDYIVNRGLPAGTFFSFVGLLLPSFFGIVLPIATFCAILFVYHKLIMDSELVVLRSAGLSQLQLGLPALLLTGLTTAAVYSISLYFMPVSYHEFKEMQYRIRTDYSTLFLAEGAFTTVSKGMTVFIRARAADGALRGVLMHDNRDPARPVTMMAESGALIHTEAGPRVVLANGNRQQVEADGGRLSILYFDRYTVELTRQKDTLEGRWRDPKERFLPELLNPGSTGNEKRYRNQLIAEGHNRLVAPLYTITFVMIGLACLLSGEFNRRGQTRRVLFAIACVAILEGGSLSLHDLAGRGPQAIPAMYAAAILPALISLIFLVRGPRRRAQSAGPAQAVAQ